MYVKSGAVVLFLFALSAQAQENATPQMQAMYGRINMEVNANLQCVANSIAVSQQLKEAQQKLKSMQEKYEPSTDKKPD